MQPSRLTAELALAVSQRPGMDQPVGNAAINHVPRQMIEAEVLEVCRMADYKGALKVIISIPKGVRASRKNI